MIVTQAREPLFYRDLGVPDTVNGRFDLLLMHLWLVLRRLKSVEAGTGLSQALFDHFCEDMDDNLREMGVGDLAVPKRMRAFGEAFYGRSAAYDMALTEGREAFAQALCKNVFNGEKIEKARELAAYAEAAMAALAASGEADAARRKLANFRRRQRRGRSDEQARQDRIPGASLSRCSRYRRRGLHRELDADEAVRKAMAEVAGLARSAVGACVARRDAEERRPLPCRGKCPGACWPDLRGDARADRERHRRADRPDVRAAGANSANWPISSTMRLTATRKRRIRRSRSRTASSISAGSPPTRCFSPSIPIRARRTRCSSTRSRRPIRRIIPLPR